MRIGNLSGRLALFTDRGAVDVADASGGRFDLIRRRSITSGMTSSAGPARSMRSTPLTLS